MREPNPCLLMLLAVGTHSYEQSCFLPATQGLLAECCTFSHGNAGHCSLGPDKWGLMLCRYRKKASQTFLRHLRSLDPLATPLPKILMGPMLRDLPRELVEVVKERFEAFGHHRLEEVKDCCSRLVHGGKSAAEQDHKLEVSRVVFEAHSGDCAWQCKVVCMLKYLKQQSTAALQKLHERPAQLQFQVLN